MSAISKIEWTDRTWNPVRGCSIVSPGCVNCYAMKQAHRFSGPGRAYEGLTKQTKAGPQWNGDIRLVEEALMEPLSWRKPARVFVNSMSDLFHEGVPDEFIDRVFAVMHLAERHTFQILTKRANRMQEYVTSRTECDPSHVAIWTEQGPRQRDGVSDGLKYRVPWPLPNVWLGVSAEDQQRADERIPLLLQTPAAVRFVSAEPLLGPVDLMRWMPHQAAYRIHAPSRSGKQQSQCVECGRVTAGFERECRTIEMGDGPDWVIVGGESGPGARPCGVAWMRGIVQQCQSAGVSVFLKQLGARPRLGGACDSSFTNPVRVTASSGGVDIVLQNRKGGDPAEWPADLRVREFPRSAVPR